MITKNTLFKQSLIALSCLLLVACDKESVTENQQEKVIETPNGVLIVKDDDGKNLEKFVEQEIEEANKVKASAENETEENAEEISWDKLVPADYDPNAAIEKYIKKLDTLQDSDQEAMEIYGKIQAVLDNAPVNKELDGKTIKMPGFVAPLENNNGIISEFLLVPYFGACIHTPPPPVNQTVMIKAGKDQGVKSENSSLPVWITGKLKAVEDRTSIGTAGYRVENAKIEPYEEN